MIDSVADVMRILNHCVSIHVMSRSCFYQSGTFLYCKMSDKEIWKKMQFFFMIDFMNILSVAKATLQPPMSVRSFVRLSVCQLPKPPNSLKSFILPYHNIHHHSHHHTQHRTHHHTQHHNTTSQHHNITSTIILIIIHFIFYLSDF